MSLSRTVGNVSIFALKGAKRKRKMEGLPPYRENVRYHLAK
jgi:hypothetical protein